MSQFSLFQAESLLAHNNFRAQHGAAQLKLNVELCRVAQDWANHLAVIGEMKHSSSDYGENLYWTSTQDVSNGHVAVQAWYNEIKDYNFNKAEFSLATGHFTALVWKSTTELGVAKASGRNGTYVVANYKESGNIEGEFVQNVLPPQYAQGPPIILSPTYAGQTPGAVIIQPGPLMAGSTVVVTGNCPNCRIGFLEDSYGIAALFLAIFFFPIGILCCLAMKEKRCTACGFRY